MVKKRSGRGGCRPGSGMKRGSFRRPVRGAQRVPSPERGKMSMASAQSESFRIHNTNCDDSSSSALDEDERATSEPALEHRSLLHVQQRLKRRKRPPRRMHIPLTTYNRNKKKLEALEDSFVALKRRVADFDEGRVLKRPPQMDIEAFYTFLQSLGVSAKKKKKKRG